MARRGLSDYFGTGWAVCETSSQAALLESVDLENAFGSTGGEPPR